MAFNDFHVDTTASDNNGGTSEGSADVSGTAGATDGTATVVLDGGSDLSGVVAGDAIRIAGETNGINGSDIFEISSVDDGADTVTVVQTPGTASGLTWAIGGAWATVDRSMNIVASGNKVWVKSSADYTETATIDTVGTSTAPIVYEGYATTTGDTGKATMDAGGARATNITSSVGVNTDLYYVFKNFIFENATGRNVNLVSWDQITCKRCEFNNSGTEGIRVRGALSCERCVAMGATDGFWNGNAGHFFGCYSHLNSSNGIQTTYGIVNSCVFVGNSGANIRSFGGGPNNIFAVINCTLDGNGKDSTHGIETTGIGSNTGLYANNIIYDHATGITEANNKGELQLSLNNLLNANTADYSGADTFSGEVTGAPLFTAEGSDYSLQSGSPAKAAGMDAGELVGDGTSYVDIGGIQRQEPAGGGGLNPILGG